MSMNNLSIVTRNEARDINGGKTYSCPFCHGYSGGYWSVYGHALKCSYYNSTIYRIGWNAAFRLLKKGLGL
jgi:hypothetical protein